MTKWTWGDERPSNPEITARDRAFKEGMVAWKNGLTIFDNPHPRESVEALCWANGLEEGAMLERLNGKS